METRGRSRSKTPFTGVEEFAKEYIEKGSFSQKTVIRSTRSTTYRKEGSYVQSNDEVTSVADKPSRKSTRLEKSAHKLYRTSDYSSEDGETEVSASISRFQNDKNQLIEDARAAANGNSEVSAFELYKSSGRYWDVYPKTDWTYSPHSRDRVELAPGVVAMPNMSRKAIHSTAASVAEFAHKETNTETLLRRQEDATAAAAASVYRSRQLFNNNHEYQSYKKVSYTRSQWLRIRRTLAAVFAAALATSHFLFRVQTSWLARVHQFAGRVMLLDTWLLWKAGGGNKAAKLATLCAVPLVLLGGWYTLTTLGGILQDTSHPNSTSPYLVAPPPKLTEPPPRPITTDPPDELGAKTRPVPDAHELTAAVLGSPGFQEVAHRLDAAAHELRELKQQLAEQKSQLRRETALRLRSCCWDAGRLSKNQEATPSEGSPPSEEAIERVVRRMLRVYDADKTGRADFAMESMGGQVVSTRCTEAYRPGRAVVSLLGVPLWHAPNSPRTVITPGNAPGDCWAFQGFPGFLVVRLARRVRISAVSLEHISRMAAPDGDVRSAPRDLQVLGLSHEDDDQPIDLGRFVYDVNGEPVQVFEVGDVVESVFEVVELRVLSNHGHPNYTCLYRFRVHGRGEA